MNDVVVPASAAEEANGTWRLLLPAAVSGPVGLVDLEPGTAAAFRRSYPAAITLSTHRATLRGIVNGVYWDGRHWPLRQGALALLVADERHANPTVLDGALRAGGRRAAIVSARRPHSVVPYPHAGAVERLLRPGWPASTDVPGQLLRERLATSPLWRLTDRSGLALDPDGPGLVDDVVTDLGSALGTPAVLRGFVVSGGDNVILRVGLASTEAALRLCLTELGAYRLLRQRRVLSGIDVALSSTDLYAHMPRELASGETYGLPWRAETWHQGHLGAGGKWWRPGGPGWAVAHDLARLVCATTPTGRAGSGWARAWAWGMDQFGAGVPSALEAALWPIQEFHVPTAWCHGDLWPGNIVLGRGPAVVLDWEQGRPNAPLGLDETFLELSRLALSTRLPIGLASARAIHDPEVLAAPPRLAGVPWAEAGSALRAAYVVAAFVIHAIGPEGDRRGTAWAEENLRPVLSALVGS